MGREVGRGRAVRESVLARENMVYIILWLLLLVYLWHLVLKAVTPKRNKSEIFKKEERKEERKEEGKGIC